MIKRKPTLLDGDVASYLFSYAFVAMGDAVIRESHVGEHRGPGNRGQRG